jgi:uncharacterized membrane protein
MATVTTSAHIGARTRRYGSVVGGLMLAAFTLSLVHTVYAWLADLADPDFSVTTPLAWGFYAVAFAVAFLAQRDTPAAEWTVAAYLLVVLVIAVLYYPTTFTPAQQTVFGWFENDVYVGLLVAAFVLQVLRLRDVSLVARR